MLNRVHLSGISTLFFALLLLGGLSFSVNINGSCINITSPGVWTVNQDLSGAPVNASSIFVGWNACLVVSSSDVLIECDSPSRTITGASASNTVGIAIARSLNNVTIRNCPGGINSYHYGIHFDSVSNINITNVSLRNSLADGIRTFGVAGSSNVYISNTLINRSNVSGMQLWMLRNATILNNTVYNSSTQYNTQFCSNCTFKDNVAMHSRATINTSTIPFQEYGGYNNSYINNTAFDPFEAGTYVMAFLVSSCEKDRFINNTAYDSGIGFDIRSSTNNSLFDGNTARNNNYSGMMVWQGAHSNNFTVNRIYSNNNSGFMLLDAGTGNSFSGNIMFNNTRSFLVNNTGSSFSYVMNGSSFYNSAGTGNFTNFSVADTVPASSSYSINWTAAPGSPPPLPSFGARYVDITAFSGTVSLESASWSWLDGELSGFDETRFQVWKYNGSWSQEPASLSAGTNTITASNLVPGSAYGILEGNETDPLCGDTISGGVTLTHNLRNSTGGEICPALGLIIGANDSVLDCAGYNMTGDGGTTNDAALLISGLHNVTIKNCGIYRFGYINDGTYNLRAVPVYYSSGVVFDNVTMNITEGNTHGIYFYDTNASSVLNSNLSATGGTALYVYGESADYNVFRNDTVAPIGSGAKSVIVDLGDNTTFDNCTIRGSTNQVAIWLTGSATNTSIINSTVTVDWGTTIDMGYGNFDNLLVRDSYVLSTTANTLPLHVNGAPHARILNNRINSSPTTDGSHGIQVTASDYVLIDGNNVTSTAKGIYLAEVVLDIQDSRYANVTNNRFDCPEQMSFFVGSSTYNPAHFDHLFINNTGDGKNALYFGPNDANTNLTDTSNVTELWIAKNDFLVQNVNMTTHEGMRVVMANNTVARNLFFNDTIKLNHIYLDHVSNATFRDMFLPSYNVSSEAPFNTVILLTDASNSSFNNFTMPTSGFLEGIYLAAASSNNRFSNFSFSSTSRTIEIYGSYVGYNIFEDFNATSTGSTFQMPIFIRYGANNTFRNFRANATGDSGIQIYYGDNYSISNCDVSAMSSGIRIEDGASLNRVENCSLSGGNYAAVVYITTDSDNNSVTNSNITAKPDSNCVVVAGGSDNTTFANNNITSLSTTYNLARYVVYLGQANNTNFTNNTVAGLYNDKIYIESNAGPAYFIANRIGASDGNIDANSINTQGGANTTVQTFRDNVLVGPRIDALGFNLNMTNSTFLSNDSTTQIVYPAISFNGSASFRLNESDFFVRNNISAVDPASASLNQQFNTTANVTFFNVNCSKFSIHRNASFSTNSSQVPNWPIVGTQANIGGNCTGNVCTNISCSGGNLSFIAPSWSSYSVTNTTACTVPTNDYLVNSSTTFCSGTYYINDTGTAGVIIANANNINITCENTTIVGNGAGSGILASSRSGLNITGCGIAYYAYGMNLSAVTSSNIRGNSIANTTSHGIYNPYPSYNLFSGNSIINATSAGISLYHDGNSVNYGFSTLDNNTISGPAAGHCIYLQGSAGVGQGLKYVNITNNVFGNSSYGISIYGYNNGAPGPEMFYYRVENNTCVNATRCINLYHNGGWGKLQHSVFNNNTLRDSTYGVYIQGTCDSCVSQNNFTGNKFENISANGVFFTGTNDYKNRFWGANTFDGSQFYHFYGDTDLALDGFTVDVHPNATNLCAFTVVQVNRFNVSNISIRANRDCAFYSWDSDNLQFRGNNVTNATTGVWLYLSTNATVRDSIIQNTTSTGIYDTYPLYDAIVNNSLRNVSTAGIYVFKDTNADYGWSTLANNTIDGPASGYSIYLHGIGGVFQGIKYVNVSGNALGNSTYGVFIYGQGTGAPTPEMYYNRISNNTIRNTTRSIYLIANGDTGRLRYNTFENNILQDSQDGIYIDGNGDFSVGYNNFSGNNLTGISRYGVYFTNSNHYKNSFWGANTFEGRAFYHYFNDANVSVGPITVDVSPNATNLCPFTVVSVRNFTLSGANISANGDCGIYSWGSANFTAEGGRIWNATNAIWTYFSVNNTFRNNSIWNASVGIYDFNPLGDRISGNVVQNTTGTGIYLQTDTWSTSTYYGNSSIDNNSVSGPSGGSSIYLHALCSVGKGLQHVNVTGNIVGNSTYGLNIYGNGCGAPTPSVYYNRISGNNCSNATRCLTIYADGDSGDLKYNSFDNNSATASSIGIYIGGTGTNSVAYNNFSNMLINATYYPLYLLNANAPSRNNFLNITFRNDNSSNFILNPGASDNFTNVTFARNGGAVNFPSGPIVLSKSVNSTNAIINSDIASINSTSLSEFAIPANVTSYTSQCPAIVFWKTGFPPNSSNIIATGSQCTGPQCTPVSCANDSVTFSVANFSGYTANVTNCMEINTSGSYSMTMNFTGAPFLATPLAGYACIKIAASNVLFDCGGHSITGNDNSTTTYGIVLNGSLRNVTVRNCPAISNYSTGIYSASSNDSMFLNNTAFNNTLAGFQLAGGYNNTIAGSTGFSNNYSSFFFTSLRNSTIANNSALYGDTIGLLLYSNSNYNSVVNNSASGNENGISLSTYSNSNNLSVNRAYNNSQRGFVISSSNGNNLSWNTAYENAQYGYYVLFCENNTLFNNTAFNNSQHGFYLYSSNSTGILGNRAYNHPQNGFIIYLGANNSASNNTATNNSGIGMDVDSADNTWIGGDHYFANSRDMAVSESAAGAPLAVNLSNVVFDNDLGSYQNFTNLSLSDIIQSETYSIDWATNSTPLPPGRISFAQKFVNITNQTPGAIIDSLVWSWTDPEVGVMDETRFDIYKYNSSGWADMNATLNAGANTLTLSSHSPASTYAVLQEHTCPPPITSSGAYNLTEGVIGAPYGASPLGGYYACIKIGASDVVFDCLGHTITDNGTTNSIGVLINGTYANVTVRNCYVSNYSYGFYAYGADNGSFINNTAHNNSFYGFYLTNGATNNVLSWNNASQNLHGGFVVNSDSDYNNLTGNRAENDTDFGFYVENGCDYFLIANNSAYNIRGASYPQTSSFYIQADNSTFRGNYVFNDTGIGKAVTFATVNNDAIYDNTVVHSRTGFTFFFTYDSNITNNTAFNVTQGTCFEMGSSSRNRFVRNNATLCYTHGFEASSSNNVSFDNNTAIDAYGPPGRCFYAGGGDGHNFTGNLARNCTVEGFNIASSTNATLANNTASFSDSCFEFAFGNIRLYNNTAYNCTTGYLFQFDDFNDIAGNRAFNLSGDGFFLDYSDDSNLTGNVVHDCASLGTARAYRMTTSARNRLVGNTADNCTWGGFDLGQSTLVANSSSRNSSRGNGLRIVQNSNVSNFTTSGNVIGVFLDNADNSTLARVAVANSTSNVSASYGVFLESSDNVSFMDLSVIDSSQYGLHLRFSSNGTYRNVYVRNGSTDFYYNALAGSGLGLINFTVDNPSGGFINYTTFNLSDIVESNYAFLINWTTNSSALPPSRISFEGKFLNISPVSGTVRIDSMNWSWADAEVTSGGYIESFFELWKYNATSNWTLQNNTPNTGANLLGLTNMNPASHYAILQQNDTVAPAVTLNSPPNGFLTNSSTVTFSFTATDNLSATMNCSFYLDGSLNRTNATTLNSTPFAFAVSNIADGSHTWYARCTDLANNTGTSVTWNFTVDTTPPAVTLNSPPNNFLTNSSTVTFSFTAVDNLSATMNCSFYLDGSLNRTNATTLNNTPFAFAVSNIADGSHTWYARCTDLANNTGTSVTWNFTVDTAPPVVSLNSPPNNLLTNSSTVDFNFTAIDNLSSTLSCSIYLNGIMQATNASVLNNTPTVFRFVGLAEGTLNWSVRCTDLANNSGASPTRNLTIDTTPPVVTLNSPPNGFLTNSSTVTFSFTATDNLSATMNCSFYLDGNLNRTNATTQNSTPFVFPVSNIADGSHSWYARCTDLANNTGTSATWNFTVDTTPPIVTLNSPPNGWSSNSTSVTFNFTAVDNLSPTMDCLFFLDGSPSMANSSTLNNTPAAFSIAVADGSHSWYVRCTDQANNTGFSPTWNLTVSTAAPPEPEEDEEEDRPLSISARSTCNGTIVTATSRGEPVRNVEIEVDGDVIGDTDSGGKVSFEGCGKRADIRASKSGYVDDSLTISLIDCESCEIKPPKPPEVKCDCGEIINATCVPFQCCYDGMCKGSERCDIPAGKEGGTCQPIVGDCGEAMNHTFVPYGYECGSEPGCPSCPPDQACTNHTCVTSDLRAPETGFVGNETAIEAFRADTSCAFCDIEVVTPAGNRISGRTDASGLFLLPLTLEGPYKVSLVQEGVPTKSVTIRALPVSAPEEPLKPTVVTSEDWNWLIWLLILLFALFIALLYWRRKKEKEKPREKAAKK